MPSMIPMLHPTFLPKFPQQASLCPQEVTEGLLLTDGETEAQMAILGEEPSRGISPSQGSLGDRLSDGLGAKGNISGI